MKDMFGKISRIDMLDLDFDSMMKRIKAIEDDLQCKVDQDVYDNEIAAIRSMIGNIDYDPKNSLIQSSGPVMVQSSLPFSTKEIADLKSMLERMPQLEDQLQKILK